MLVREVHLRNFMRFTDVSVRLPERGLVLVTGANGEGKSGLAVESVAMALFGKTLRGTPPWSGTGASVRVVAGEVDVTRRPDGQKLTWNLPGEEPRRYDTPTKAQDALAGVVGSFDVWRRTSVFSATDAAHFSLATDKERKTLLETILGLDRFDSALRACRDDLSNNKQVLSGYETKERVLRERIRGLEARLKDLDESDESERAVVEPLVPKEKQASLRKLLGELMMQVGQLEQQQRARVREVVTAEAELRQARRALEQLDKDACPTCGQSIPKKQRAELRKTVEAASEQHRALADRAHKADLTEQQELIDLQLEAGQVRSLVEHAAEIERDHMQLKQLADIRDEKRAPLEAELSSARAQLAEVEEHATLMRRDVEELRIAESVLGLRGVRAHMLAEATAAITQLANGWLARLFPGVTAELAEESDKLALRVEGLAHPHGYRGASSGQRRRIDIALLFALSDLEAASRGVQRGTLVLDEVADSLDEEGLVAFTDVIDEVARTTCVVIITHHRFLHEGLAPVAHFFVREGAVTEH